MFRASVNAIDLRFETDPSLFSPSRPDRGTLALLSSIAFEPEDKILDLGCGYGLVGIYAAKRIEPSRVWMIDNDETALISARRNIAINDVAGVHVLQSDGFRDFNESDFTKIIFNPPYHADFSVPKHFIEKGFNRLVVGGSMFLVTKRALWYRNKLTSVFGGCRVQEVDSYFVLSATKRAHSYAHRNVR